MAAIELTTLMDCAWEIAGIVNRNAPRAVRGRRLAIRKSLSLSPYEAQLMAEGYRMKGARAFLEQRDPDWKFRQLRELATPPSCGGCPHHEDTGRLHGRERCGSVPSAAAPRRG